MSMWLLLIAMNRGRDVVLVDFIHVRAGIQQEPRRIDVAFARGIHQRSHFSGNRRADSPFGKTAANDPDAMRAAAGLPNTGQPSGRRRAGSRAYLNVGSALDQDGPIRYSRLRQLPLRAVS